MAVPVEDTVAVGAKISAAWGNANVRDAVNFLLAPPRVYAYQSGAPTWGTGSTIVCPFDSELYDTDSMHSTVTNTSRVVATTAGLYNVSALMTFVSNATGIRTCELRKNAAGNVASGTRIAFWAANAVGGSTVTNAGGDIDVQMSAGDYLEIFGFQNSGSTLACASGSPFTFLEMRWVASS